ncbi:Asp-tRNA(Asn)/Glu-tRNA(Gln) amidotransferase subunit GatC [Thermoclostridium stercorarium]|uniref:Asp-tRNA(Asn)/Glu-tRNA(Gln) amidotransferase subunit GatC n=1 Tax=Thermoclostridium stercorarium TaxID=1510 RepID=UPI000A457B23|nr:Asp-tRNA(Asn)/Glu-tRNA(Gln) amidotransferase subunit GatC [Thermoclostridium stercorarium]
MAISKNEIEKLAKLAKLSFSDEELERFTAEFDEIIAFANTINQYIEGGTEQIRSVGARIVSFDDLRPDEVEPSLPVRKSFPMLKGITDFSGWKGAKNENGNN